MLQITQEDSVADAEQEVEIFVEPELAEPHVSSQEVICKYLDDRIMHINNVHNLWLLVGLKSGLVEVYDLDTKEKHK